MELTVTVVRCATEKFYKVCVRKAKYVGRYPVMVIVVVVAEMNGCKNTLKNI
jgi:hypothetical protein